MADPLSAILKTPRKGRFAFAERREVLEDFSRG